ncbi:response regulator transcription factor [Ohessyouella blattaphilus]|uniref:Stage 0 sporulation protein A homolog n=1 Tax=Ohessyouella blattaphilus TaxID=2949333 RepID=A0ABT1EFS5_9FIRM|nr:response regulator [Ohessyouella blattaphilus]MCP1109555.1 response regulator [Ohessyouella blattaphilus]MCR8562949.1 response regulator [Ohessyouella blattaphilus]
MYKIVVADDEKNIQEGIEELIDWESLGCCICETMRNGQQVLNYLDSKTENIDIVITDIKMPVMGGLELAKALSERYPMIKIVILTAYGEFSYAQQAIKYRVADFVAKSDFFTELPEVIERITKQIDEEQKSLDNQLEINLLSGEMLYRVCICEVKSLSGDINRDMDVCRGKVEELVMKTFPKHETVTFVGDAEQLFILVEHKNETESSIWFQKKLEKIVLLAASFQNIQLRIGVGSPMKANECMSYGKKLALRNLSDICTDKMPVNTNEESKEYVHYWFENEDIDIYMRVLYAALRNGTEDEQAERQKEFQSYLKVENRSFEQCKSDTHAILSYLIRKIGSVAKKEKVLSPKFILDAVYCSQTKATLADIMQSTCSVIASFLADKGTGNHLVEKVNNIIASYYQEKLSLKDISQKLFVNSSYLSRIYKKDTGITVTDAINIYRIEKAKLIMKEGGYKIYEVGKLVGFDDPSYFTHVFLKYEGKNPSDYMNEGDL